MAVQTTRAAQADQSGSLVTIAIAAVGLLAVMLVAPDFGGQVAADSQVAGLPWWVWAGL